VSDDARPVLVGMNNPMSDDPAHALYPLPLGCAGSRLWEMLAEETGATRQQYLRAFERVNLVVGPWSRAAARVGAAQLSARLAGRTAILLGAQVRDAFGHSPTGDVLAPYQVDGTLFYQLPHPSGRNLWYNHEANRRRAGQVLGDVYLGGR
jgi:hypothetical protein